MWKPLIGNITEKWWAETLLQFTHLIDTIEWAVLCDCYIHNNLMSRSVKMHQVLPLFATETICMIKKAFACENK